MANIREIKQRITSVKKTKKITQAMKMVSAAKFKRASHRVNESKAYKRGLESIFADMATRLEEDELPTLFLPNKSKNHCIIIVAGDRGLCGAFNSNVIKKTNEVLASLKKEDINLQLIGNKVIRYYAGKQWEVKRKEANFMEGLDNAKVITFFQPIIEQYKKGEIGKVTIIYNEFISALSNETIEKQILPIDLPDWDPQKKLEKADYIYEPGKISVLENLLSKFLQFNLLNALLESKASEEGARMAAMESATDNATEMIKDLSLIYNRNRQAAITTEISEIVAGAVLHN